MLGPVKGLTRLCAALLALFSVVAQADVLEDILERGSVRVGVSPFAPWTMVDDSGSLAGFEIDVGNKIAEDMGVEAEFRNYKWEDIIPALVKGEIDVIAAGMAVTPGRALTISFSQGYSDAGISLATNTPMTRHIGKLEQLNGEGIVIAVVKDTVSVGVAQSVFDKAETRTYESVATAQQAVLDDEAHAYIGATPLPKFLALQHPNKVDMPLQNPLLEFKTGMAVQKGEQEMLNFLNAWITARTADKWLSATHKYWFDSLDWRGDDWRGDESQQ